MSNMKCRRPRGKELDLFTRSLALRWGTDPKTIKALEKMRTKELKEKANKIAQDAINKIKERPNEQNPLRLFSKDDKKATA